MKLKIGFASGDTESKRNEDHESIKVCESCTQYRIYHSECIHHWIHSL